MLSFEVPIRWHCLLASSWNCHRLLWFPYSSDRRCSRGCGRRHLLRALNLTLKLHSAEVILHWPAHSREAELRRGMECPLRVGKVRASHGNQICAPRGDDAVHLVGVG